MSVCVGSFGKGGPEASQASVSALQRLEGQLQGDLTPTQAPPLCERTCTLVCVTVLEAGILGPGRRFSGGRGSSPRSFLLGRELASCCCVGFGCFGAGPRSLRSSASPRPPGGLPTLPATRPPAAQGPFPRPSWMPPAMVAGLRPACPWGLMRVLCPPSARWGLWGGGQFCCPVQCVSVSGK